MATKQVQRWERCRVNHLAVVHAYYGDRMRVKSGSLQIPEKAYFVSAQSTNPKTLRKASRKRARELVRQEERIAAGTFVPLDEALKAELLQAHEDFLSEGDLAEIVPVRAKNGDADDRTCGFEDEITTATATIASDDKLHTNDTDDFQIVAMQDSGGRVLLPARASFAMRDVRSLTDLPLGRFKLIVMDPPWENKSVGRSKRYTTFHHTELLKIDICSLADTDEHGAAAMGVHVPYDVVLAQNAWKLELFARELRPGWTSIGNEVLKFQTASLFETAPSKSIDIMDKER
uniref:Uncharacterized protein n=1 Tax=Globisporangium ultimum (strain ATCC 200006 / CBS 805.95 / DAOM BR144) TaxID=431595 RepID=K3W6K4_GLOUD